MLLPRCAYPLTVVYSYHKLNVARLMVRRGADSWSGLSEQKISHWPGCQPGQLELPSCRTDNRLLFLLNPFFRSFLLLVFFVHVTRLASSPLPPPIWKTYPTKVALYLFKTKQQMSFTLRLISLKRRGGLLLC
jgi:hypothetical protein